MCRQNLVALLLFSLTACGGGGDTSPPENPKSIDTIELQFSRLDNGTPNPFIVTVDLSINGKPKSGLAADIQIQLQRGSHNAVSEIADGRYQFTVTPVQTGEYRVKVSYNNLSVERTALVFDSVQSGWGQPMAVSGLVNTAGYEDGVTISPDGEYLFVQYGPLYFSAIYLFSTARDKGGCGNDRLQPDRCTHPWLDETIGPYDAPQRPGFFSGRIEGGKWLHNASSWGLDVEQASIFAPSTMLYGFRRQEDGSFAEPFYLSFIDENDAIINASGLSMMLHGNDQATILFALDDPSDPDMVDLNGDGSLYVESLHDIYTTQITLGQDTLLGTFVASGTAGTPPVRGTPFPSKLVNFGKTGIDGIAGTQGNPHLFYVGQEVKSIWTDDERDAPGAGSDRGDLAVYGLTSGSFPNGDWVKILLPEIVNQPWPSGEFQPFFTGSGLYYTHMNDSDGEAPEIYYAAYHGTQSLADYVNTANWDTPVKILGVGNSDALGKIAAIGEPTIADYHGEQYLYFVYGYIRGYDAQSGLPDIDMQAGFIKKQP